MPTYHSVLMLISNLECSALSLLKFALQILFSFSVADHQLYALCGLRTLVQGDISRLCIRAAYNIDYFRAWKPPLTHHESKAWIYLGSGSL